VKEKEGIVQYFKSEKEPPEMKEEIERKIFLSNLRNLHYLVILGFLVCMINLINDFFSQKPLSREVFRIYVFFDSLLLIVSFVYLILFTLSQNKKIHLPKWVITLYISIAFVWAAVISSVFIDSTQGEETFLVSLMIGMMLFFHKHIETLFLLILAAVTKIISFWMIHGTLSSLKQNWVTQVIFFLVFILVSHIIYTSKCRNLIYEVRMNKALRAEAQANQAKTRFLQNISHELRTPLTGILGFSDAISQGSKDDQIQNYGKLISGEGKKLLSLINRLLDISKIESDKLELCREPFPLKAMLQSFIQSYRERASLKGIEFHSSLDEKIPDGAKGDEERISQILANLTGNALKFTEKGYISLEIDYQEISKETFSLHFRLKDTGIGIEASRLQSIFKPFEQADSSISKTFGGTGLGTTLAKELIELMGGHISVLSTPGEGSEFIFFINLEKTPNWNLTEHGSNETDSTPLKSVKILLVDDYPVNLQIASMFLSKAGALISTVNNGKECLDKLEQERFDLILMDVHMPVMDGLETIERIRRDENWKDYVVLGLTADAYEEDRRKFIACGMNEVIAKPFNRKTLLKKVTEQISFTKSSSL